MEVQEGFGFKLSELSYWMIKRKDGETVKYMLQDATRQPTLLTNGGRVVDPYAHTNYSGTGWAGSGYRACAHNGADLIYQTPDESVRLYIADAAGCRKNANLHDFTLDCGDILQAIDTPAEPPTHSGLLQGDAELVELLDEYVEASRTPSRVLQIDWDDRQQPDLNPAFWPALAEALHGDILSACQGGHGRSGTALTALLLCYNPTYSVRDAIVHLRAMHCARAIESVAQHEYLDTVARHLKRKANSKEVQQIKSFKDAFLGMRHKCAKPFQDTLKVRGAKKHG